jgi:multisubunit Na+/H+ antiporter MnhF subunit
MRYVQPIGVLLAFVFSYLGALTKSGFIWEVAVVFAVVGLLFTFAFWPKN